MLATGVPQDIKHGIDLVRDAAEGGLPNAENYMGEAYNQGTGVARNTKTSIAWYRRAAVQGHDLAQLTLGYVYEQGIGVEKSGSKALEYYTLAARTQPEALMNMGVMYYTGEAVPKDLKKALSLFRQAAALDHPHSNYWLSYFYRTGEGMAKDDAKSLEYLEKSANLGSMRAQFEMGEEFGRRGKKIPQTAVLWYEKAALQGHEEALENLLHVMDLAAWKLKTEKDKVHWIRAGAERGFAIQQWQYAKLLDAGNEVPQDADKAFEYGIAAAEGDHVPALRKMGLLLLQSDDYSDEQKKQGRQFIQKAAKKGEGQAQFTLAELYANGYYVEQDWQYAVMWGLIAKHFGFEDADNLIRAAASYLPDEETFEETKGLAKMCIATRFEVCTR